MSWWWSPWFFRTSVFRNNGIWLSMCSKLYCLTFFKGNSYVLTIPWILVPHLCAFGLIRVLVYLFLESSKYYRILKSPLYGIWCYQIELFQINSRLYQLLSAIRSILVLSPRFEKKRDFKSHPFMYLLFLRQLRQCSHIYMSIAAI